MRVGHAWLLVAVALVVWALWPCRVTLEGPGVVRPRFERLVLVVPRESGVVCRACAHRMDSLRAGDLLFEYVPMAKAGFRSQYAPDEQPSQWSVEADRERAARIEAAQRWSARVLRAGPEAPRWEHDLAARLGMVAGCEADLARRIAQRRENDRLGREEANAVYVVDERLGEFAAATRGVPLASPAPGVLYSLWVEPGMQFNGRPEPDLPTPPPGSPPVVALAAGGAPPVAEIMPFDAPGEIVALVPIPPQRLSGADGWRANVSGAGFGKDAAGRITAIAIGQVPIASAEAKLATPELPTERAGVFARMELADVSPSELDTPVRVRLTSPPRARVWLWFEQRGGDGGERRRGD